MKIYNENKESKTKEEITKMIKDALNDIRFNEGRGYFFIYSFDYECILLPISKKTEGTSFYNFQDSKGTYLTREIIKQLKTEKEGFLSWYFPKPDDLTKTYRKIGFNIHFEPYDWFIGTGEYFDDYEKEVKEKVLDYISRIVPSEENYFFILDYDKKTLFHVIKDLINQPSKIVTNVENQRVFDDMLFMAKQGDGFLTYKHKPFGNDDFSIKTSYIKGLQNWEWIIGKGFYHDKVEELIKNKTDELNTKFEQKILNILTMALILTFVLLLISLYISKLIDKKFKKYKKDINKYIDLNNKQQHILSQQSKMASMGEMLGNIAHQWRQPLSLITTAATGMKLQKEFDTLDDKAFNESIDNITNSALYLSKTIDDFRNFFRTDKESTIFTIKQSLEKVSQLTKASFKNYDISCEKDIEDIEIFGLENEFLQALINIINNSKDALVATKENEKVILISSYFDKKTNKAIIKIKDNAGGIDEDIIDKISEPYFTTKHQSKGTGIGLYMTEEIILKHMNGNLYFKNVDFIYKDKTYRGLETTIELSVS